MITVESKIVSIIQHIGNMNRAKGFWDEIKSTKCLTMLVIGELAEGQEAHRKGKFSDKLIKDYKHLTAGSTEDYDKWFKEYIKDTFEDELADAFIRICDITSNSPENIVYGMSNYILMTSFYDWHGQQSIKKVQDIGAELFAITDMLIRLEFENALISIAELCKSLDIDLPLHVLAKVQYNANRPYKHGKNY